MSTLKVVHVIHAFSLYWKQLFVNV